MATKNTHTIKSIQVILSASSPDDEALVLGAKYFGFEFINRIDSSAVLDTWDVTAPPSAFSSPTPPKEGKDGATSATASTTPTAVGVEAGEGGTSCDGVNLAVSDGGGREAAGRAKGASDDMGDGKPKVNRVSYEVRRASRCWVVFLVFGAKLSALIVFLHLVMLFHRVVVCLPRAYICTH